MQLPTYQCFKQVQAAKISRIILLNEDAHITETGHAALFFEGSNDNITVDEAWLTRFKPEVGGYFVQYEDGYTSFSPAKAFESGYVRI